MKYILLLGSLVLLAGVHANAQTPKLVKDMNSFTGSSNAAFFTTSAGSVYFTATNELAQPVLYKTDGTMEGTVPIKINITIRAMADVNGTLFIADGNGATTAKLYKSDGTDAGTILLKTFTGGFANDITLMTNINGKLCFKMGSQLWISDGTAEGTVMLKQFNPSIGTSLAILNLINYNGTLVVSASTAAEGTELWKSDGTVGGTVLVKDIIAGTGSSMPDGFCVVNNLLFFSAWNCVGSTDGELWKTDGTDAGTVMVKDIRAGTPSSSPTNLTNLDGTLFFTADDGSNGRELWKSDGSAAGTVLLKDLNTGSANANPANLLAIGSHLFFTATDVASPAALWKTDGTGTGTVKIPAAELNITAFSSFCNLNGTLCFRGVSAITGNEIYKSDGTDEGTQLIKDIYPGTVSSNYNNGFVGADNFAVLKNTILFGANNRTQGIEPWISDGTEAGTLLLKDIKDYTLSSAPANLTDVNGALFFSASDGTGTKLWKSDGTLAGTAIVKNATGALTNFCNVNGSLFFSGQYSYNNAELWKSDGTEAGTVLLEINPSETSPSSPTSFISYNERLYFFATNGTTGMELWTSDGSVAGTQTVKDARPDNVNVGSPRPVIVIANNTMFYAFDDGTTGGELWKSDGTAAGTQLVKDIYPDINYSAPTNLTNVNGTLFFTATDGVNGTELWKSDGSTSGTVMVKDITAGSSSSTISNLVSYNGTLYFAVRRQLWKSDGTAEGTVLVNDFVGNSPNINNLIDVGGVLFITQGGALFKSDGTAAGIVAVLNGLGGVQMGSATNLIASGNTLYFSSLSNPFGATVSSGYELWKCVNTGNVATVFEINPGNASSSPTLLTFSNGNLFFAATTLASNTELWSLAVGGGAALTTSWTGAVDTDWHNAANWSDGVPAATSTAIIPVGMPRYPIISINTAVKKIVAEPGTNVNVAQGVYVNILGL